MSKITYDFTDAVGGNYINEEGAQTVKVKEIAEHPTKSGDGCLKITLENKANEIVNTFVMYEGKGAFNFKLFLDALKVKSKEQGGLDTAKLIGKTLDIELVTNPQDSRYLQVAKFAPKGTLTSSQETTPDTDTVEDADDEIEDFWS